MSKRAKNQVFGHYIEFAWLDWSDIAYSDRGKRTLSTDRNQGFRNPLNLCIIVTIRHKRAKNEDFGHSIKFGLFGWSDTA